MSEFEKKLMMLRVNQHLAQVGLLAFDSYAKLYYRTIPQTVRRFSPEQLRKKVMNE